MSATLEIVCTAQMQALQAEVARLREELAKLNAQTDRLALGVLVGEKLLTTERADHEATKAELKDERDTVRANQHAADREYKRRLAAEARVAELERKNEGLGRAKDKFASRAYRAETALDQARGLLEAWETEAGHAADLNDSRRSNTLRDCAAQLRAITTTATPTGQLGKMLCIACEVYFVSFAAMVEHCRQRHPEELEPATPPSLCEHCGKPATCCGSYEGSSAGFACDDCCGHGCEDGKCEPVTATPAATGADIVRTQDSNAYELDLPRAAKEAKGG